MNFNSEERINNHLFKYLYASLIKELGSKDEIISAGFMLGERIADDFFIKTGVSRFKEKNLEIIIVNVIKPFFKLYFDYNIETNTDEFPSRVYIKFDDFYLLENVKEDKQSLFLLFFSEIIKKIAGFLTENEINIENKIVNDQNQWLVEFK